MQGKLLVEQLIPGAVPGSSVQINSGLMVIGAEPYKLAYCRRGNKMEVFWFDLKTPTSESVATPPSQIAVLPVMAKLAGLLTVTTTSSVVVQPLMVTLT